MPAGFSWEVELPDARRASLGRARPKAQVRASSEVHGDEAFTVPLAVGKKLLAESRKDEARPASRNELLHHIGEVEAVCAHARMEGLVNLRDYSSKEMSDKLLLDGYRRDVVAATVKRACEAGVIDDERFARVYVRGKIGAGWGMGRIERELARKGIEAGALEGWPYDFLDPEEESERAYELASRRRLTGKNDYAKLVRFLMGRGFAASAAHAAARRVLDEAREEQDAR